MHESISLDVRFRSSLLSALSAVLLADGRVAPGELVALRAAARAMDLPSGPAALGAAMLGASLGPESAAEEELDPARRAVVYAAAEWMAMVDGHEGPSELAVLEKLRAALGLGPAGAARLHALASRVRSASHTGPTHAEFEALLLGALRLGAATPALA